MNLHLPIFWKHVITVLGGALGAQALPLLAAPLITRMCTPADMGAFSLWVAMVAVAAIGATLRMETAMILDHETEQQRTCFGLVLYSATITAFVVTLLAALAHLAEVPGISQLSWPALLTVGIGTWLTANMQTVLAYATSHNAFGAAARAKVVGAGTIAVAQLLLLAAGVGALGLLGGQLIGLLIGLIAARRLLHPPRARVEFTLGNDARAYLVRHRKFWRYALPSNLLNNMVGHLPLFLIGMQHGALAAGLYALTQRVLAAPISLLAASVLEVFKRQSVHEFEAHGHCKQAYRYTFKVLMLLGLAPSLVLLLFSPTLFAWVFGPAWREAGELAQILAPLYFLNFVASPLSYVFFVTGKHKVDLWWQLTLCAVTITAFLMPGTLHQNLLWFAIGYSTLYLVYLHMSWQCSQNRLAAA
jgi:O-antigen/teichoic acid export membrane protein